MEIESVGNYRARWGEGPLWWSESLYFVDIEEHKVLRYHPCSGEEQIWDVGERVGTVVPRRGGGLAIAGDRGFAFLDPGSGEITRLGDPEAGKPDNRFNDGKCSPDGRFFAGTISLVKNEGDAALYRLDADQSITKVYDGVTNSNGIVWTEDGRTLYYIDTPRRAVLAFDYDSDTGTLTNERVAFSTSGDSDGVPDGMAIDTEGHLWIAFCHGGCVVCFDQAGREMRRLDFPCREVTAPAFGGEGLRDLYVTSGIPKDEIEKEAGRLFVVRNLGATGLPANGFAG